MTKPIYYIAFALIWLGLGVWNFIEGQSVAGFVCLAVSNVKIVGCGIIMKLNERPMQPTVNIDALRCGSDMAYRQGRRLS
ncbi:hypothetical protein CMI47_05560 [Candidatus Pacearchaeota archaeon]|jgi:hypothetical protein|nr:hypothetical protein [Candidatus Pacearchaeota archaeon]|tara:strand:+ start:206 stop:445 length:240 start_codon:yes stop_codon:yes gene_type:complete